MKIELPEFACVALIGENKKEKKMFIQKYFHESEVIALKELESIGTKRLEEGKFTGIDVCKIEEDDYERIIRISKKYDCMAIAILLDEMPYETGVLELLINTLTKKGFQKVYSLDPGRENLQKGLKNRKHYLEEIEVVRMKLASNQKNVHGPFDLIGDIHGCYDELCELLEKLGYEVHKKKCIAKSVQGCKVVFLGDLVDRGPKSPEVLKLVMNMTSREEAYCTLGNHDGKLLRKLNGANVKVIHGLGETLQQLEAEPTEFIEAVKRFLAGLVSHYVFDEGRLVAVHAGLKEKFHGRESKKIRDLAMFGETTGKIDKLGLPIRLDWSKHYRGKAFVVYGHTPQRMVKIVNNTINIDTGCIFGGKLTAIRYPEKEIVAVAAKKKYFEPARPF
nr:metallophosphoesterase [uncultured Cellulosilyticum sp.]